MTSLDWFPAIALKVPDTLTRVAATTAMALVVGVLIYAAYCADNEPVKCFKIADAKAWICP